MHLSVHVHAYDAELRRWQRDEEEEEEEEQRDARRKEREREWETVWRMTLSWCCLYDLFCFFSPVVPPFLYPYHVPHACCWQADT
jgi:hypothetical protein